MEVVKEITNGRVFFVNSPFTDERFCKAGVWHIIEELALLMKLNCASECLKKKDCYDSLEVLMMLEKNIAEEFDLKSPRFARKLRTDIGGFCPWEGIFYFPKENCRIAFRIS